MKRKVFLHVTGGLGNQLFQFAAALKLAAGGPIYLSTHNGKPRRSSRSLPDLQGFRLPENVLDLGPKKYSTLAAKSSGYQLRRGISPRKWENCFPIRAGSIAATNIINSIYFRSIIKTFVAENVGNVNLPILRSNIFLVGYFQTCTIASNTEVYKTLSDLKLVEEGSMVSKYKYLSDLETPLVIHIRRGDYKSEEGFGLAGSNYYLEAIRKIVPLRHFQKIWIFTDDFESAQTIIRRIEDVSMLPVRLINDQNLSAAETLEVMRNGHGYVIANSTFSWWGAFLTKHANAPVIAPSPWFAALPEPSELIPKHWNRLNGDYASNTA